MKLISSLFENFTPGLKTEEFFKIVQFILKMVRNFILGAAKYIKDITFDKDTGEIVKAESKNEPIYHIFVKI